MKDRDVTAIDCARCGEAADWLVALVYQLDSPPAGRLMPYCDGCRAAADPALRGLTVPMSMFRLDPERLLELMYRGDATRTEPDIIADMLEVRPSGRWFVAATAAVHRS